MSRTKSKFVRKPVSKALRFEVFKRDGFQCAYCGATPPNAILECDHIEPVSKGGLTEIDNLVTACIACNRGKSDTLLSEVPQSMADRAAEVLEHESQIAGYQAALKQRRLRIEADVQEVIDAFYQEFDTLMVDKRDFASIRIFVEKIGVNDCIEAVCKAGKCNSFSSGFRYFCGVCWNKIREASL